MKGLFSLEQELRAVRASKGRKKTAQANPLPDAKETERPWQSDIDHVEQTMREVLQAMARFSGVEIPGLPAGLEDDGARLPGLDLQTLKERFRIDLEGFSVKTAGEFSKRARAQTLAALDAIKNEVSGRIDEVSAELQAQVQLPGQLEKALEPIVEKAAARLEATLTQKVEDLLAEREESFQQKLEEAQSSVQASSNTGEELSARLEASLTQKVEKLLGEREQSLQQKLDEAQSSLETASNAGEELAARLEASLTQKVEKLFGKREQSLQQKLEGVQSSVRASSNTGEELSARLEASLTQKVENVLAEREQLVQERLQGEQRSAQAQVSQIEEAKAGLEGSLSQKIDHLFAERERLAQERLQETLGPVRLQIRALEQIVQQIHELKPDSVLQLPVEQPEVAEATAKKGESLSSNGINEFLDRSLARLGASVSSATATSPAESGEGSVGGAGDQGRSIFFNEMEEKERRIQQALDELDRLGSKNPHPLAK